MFPNILKAQLDFDTIFLSSYGSVLTFADVFKFVDLSHSLRTLKVSLAIPKDCELSKFRCFSRLTSLTLDVKKLSMKSRYALLEILPSTLIELSFDCGGDSQCLALVSRRFRNLERVEIEAEVCDLWSRYEFFVD